MSFLRSIFKKPVVDPQRLIELGNEKEDAGDLTAAIAFYREALRVAPQSGRACLNLGIALAAAGNVAEAMAAYDRGLVAEAANAFLHYNRALLKYRLGDLAGAGLDVRTAVALKPDLAAGHILLSNVLDDTGETEAALEAIDAAIALHADLPGAHLNRGRLLVRLLRTTEALDAAACGLRIAPGDAELHWLA